ncbi:MULTISPECIES: hypothetical protein [Chryseobacterium]|uniref:LysM domain-containing protein n=1 Tax=Chryseobacterium camelliae TaxID=1265445 RepID=A0ABU0TJM6_9FLAO|nr:MULTISPECIES: hypothetical protein [Chryseobacterium]MDT3408916.1 hypothetical protein [Pseudacidovorax intermedius]MDQ1097227.1 hypothetical protein [Chryseobacterium camelliae]MDQ1101162.1 hypothetical protein [Chryseobacterium sp. SORGH_AS_1048]MDR6084607.1 hypothetical protein [Chryseobacterium sp. SORGH_AS_0909]MDR6132879.1 hypothetical protein [Chryseobacterium sp. SORGH_AS_1175]
MIVHFILHGETLESIAEDIKLENPLYLKEYHNHRCAREDVIVDRLIPGKRLLIPASSDIARYNLRNDAPFKSPDRNPEIPFQPHQLNQKYSVGIVEKTYREQEISQQAVFYDALLEWIDFEDGHHLFHYSKLNFYNRKDGILGDLAEDCIKSLNPIEIKTDLNGKIADIRMSQEVADRFREIKDRLLNLYPGPYAKTYIEEFAYAVQNPKFFSERMQDDIFIKTYFAPVRTPFRNGTSSYPFSLSDSGISLTVIQAAELSRQPSEIMLSQKAESEAGFPGAVYSGQYTIRKESGLVSGIRIDYGYDEYGFRNTTQLIIDEKP